MTERDLDLETMHRLQPNPQHFTTRQVVDQHDAPSSGSSNTPFGAALLTDC